MLRSSVTTMVSPKAGRSRLSLCLSSFQSAAAEAKQKGEGDVDFLIRWQPRHIVTYEILRNTYRSGVVMQLQFHSLPGSV